MGKTHEIRRQEIVDAVFALAAEYGLSRVTTQMIADHVGIAQPTVFRHFKSREQILLAAFEYVTSGLGKRTSPIFDGDLPAGERLKAVIFAHLGYIGELQGFARFMFSDQLHLDSPELRARVQSAMQAYAQRLAKLIEDGQQQRTFKASLNPMSSAEYIIAMIQGLLMRWSVFDFSFSLVEKQEEFWGLISGGLLNDAG